MQRPNKIQVALCGLGLLSAFLPWLVLDVRMFSIDLTLVRLMFLDGSSSFSLFYLLFGGIYLIGTVGLLVWKKAFVIQLAGLVVMTIPVVGTLGNILGKMELTLDILFALLGTIGAGAVLAWGVSLAGLILFGPARLRSAVRKVPYLGPAIMKLPSCNERSSGRTVKDLVSVRTAVIGEQNDHLSALASGERFMAAGDLPAALRSFGRALGASIDDPERAVSKVKIATVLDLMGKDDEASLFLQEARELDPGALSLWAGEPGPVDMRRPVRPTMLIK